MKPTAIPPLLSLAAISAGSPVETTQNEAAVEERQVASGCYPFQAPRCCIDYTVCQCGDGKFYQWNPDNYNAGGNGCDPPWGILGSQAPGYCC